MPTREDWIRLAAFLDGEGSIYIRKDRVDSRGCPSFTSLQVDVDNTDPRLAAWCRDTFGGHFGVNHSNTRHNKNCKAVYTWRVSCKAAEDIIRECLPFFLLKREQAEIALAYRKTFRGRRTRSSADALTDAEITFRNKCREDLQRLKVELPDAAKAAVN